MVSRNEASWPEGRAESDPAHDLNELALVLLRNPRAAADPHALDRAVALLRQAVDLTGSSGPARAGYLSNLANALRMRFERVGMVADLDLAIDAGTAAVQEAASGPRSGLLSNLGNALLARYRRTGQEADLLSALTSHRQAIANSAPDDPNRHIYLSALGISLRSTFERERQPALIDESIDVSERAVACAPADDPQQPSFLCNLAVSLRLRFESTGDLPDLDRAVQSLEAALRATPSGDPQHIDFLGNLGSILCLRFDHIGNLADLDRAVQALREAVDATPASHPDRVMYLGNLANALRLRYLRHTDFRDIDEAVSAAREAVRLIPVDDPIRATYLSNLGLVLGERSCARTRETSHFTPDGEADLDAAVEAHCAAVEAASPGDPNRARYLSNLGTSFHQRAEAATFGGVHTRFLGKEDVDAAVDCQQRAVDTTGPDQVARARYLGLLGGALRLRYERTSSLPDLRRAGQAYQQAALTATAPPRLRVLAAAGWGAGAAQRLDWTTANQALGLAVELLSMVATERTGRDDQRYHLDHLSGLACDAAAAALNPGDVARALALLEQGRGILLARSIAVRGEVAQLRTRHPDLADRLEWLRQELDTEIDDPIAASSGSGDRTAAASDRRRQLAAAWDSVLSEIRQRP